MLEVTTGNAKNGKFTIMSTSMYSFQFNEQSLFYKLNK